MIRITLVCLALLSTACAGPQFVRDCNELSEKSHSLALHCSALVDMYTNDKTEAEFMKVQLDTCHAENERLTKTILGEVPRGR